MHKQKNAPGLSSTGGRNKKQPDYSIAKTGNQKKPLKEAIAEFTREVERMDAGYITLRARYISGTLAWYEVTPRRIYTAGRAQNVED
ncbi:hypothetical protein FACS1894110_21220 [Spirochaetia bacterium]|nr:hypothetical protein FACS1894110_21220 [Spirochaetia bacterium]